MGRAVPVDDLPDATSRAVPANDLPDAGGVRNPVMDQRNRAMEAGVYDRYSKDRKHEARMASDPYYATAQNQGPLSNMGAAMGGVLKGLGYIGPRQIAGMSKPGEYEEWKSAMSGLNTTGGGKAGAILGYALPIAATAPLTGASTIGAAFTAGAESFLDPADSGAQRAFKTGIGAVTAGAGQKFANVIGNAATNTRAARQLRSYGGDTVRDTTLRNTLGLGYKLPPSAAGKQSLLESAGGQIKTQQAMADFNQNLTDNLIRNEFGTASKFGVRMAPNTPLTSDTMRQIRAAAGKPYQQIKELGTIELIVGRTKAGNKVVSKINTADAVESLKQLRHDGYSQLSAARASGDPHALKAAKEMLTKAGKLEDQLETALYGAGKNQLLGDLKDARQLIAKSYNVQDAIRESVGRVDARDLGALYEAGEKGFGPKLTGKLADVGKAGSAFRESMALRGFDSPRYSALDFAVGGMNIANAAAHGSPVGMLAGGIPLLRGPARDRLMSGAVQNKLIDSGLPPNALTKVMPYLLDYTPNIPKFGPYPVSRTLPPALMTGELLSE